MEKCNENKCGSEKESCYSTGCDMTDAMLRLADKAWEELMLEKMKTSRKEELFFHANKFIKEHTG